MKLLEKIKSFFNDDTPIKSEKIIIVQKSCPHCASRGMFVFNDTPKDQLNSKGSNLEPNVTLSPSKGD
ncbi:MAG: hypothetical protein IPJ03_12880 [Ignavibacteriales bacterium]|nr:hypothetical protein [Ignavibacteriales bacterium]